MSVTYPRKPLNPYKTDHLPSGYYPIHTGYEEIDAEDKPSQGLPLMNNNTETFFEPVLMNITPKPDSDTRYNPGFGFQPISSRFGLRNHPVDKEIKPHSGDDYPAKVGTTVRAAADGVVIFSNKKVKGYGAVIVIKHKGKNGNNVLTIYGHLNGKNMREVDKKVKAGEKIAESGNTGKTSGPNLHFGVVEDDTKGTLTGLVTNKEKQVRDDGTFPLGLTDSDIKTNPKNLGNIVNGIYNKRHPHYKWNYEADKINHEAKQQQMDGADTRNPINPSDIRPRPSRFHSGETLEYRDGKVWRIEEDGSTRGFVKAWSK